MTWWVTEILSHSTACIKVTECQQWNNCEGRPAVRDRRLEKLHQLLWICGVGPGRGHHLSRPQEGHLQSHGVVVEDKHLVLFLPQVLQSHLWVEGSGAGGYKGRHGKRWQKVGKRGELLLCWMSGRIVVNRNNWIKLPDAIIIKQLCSILGSE